MSQRTKLSQWDSKKLFQQSLQIKNKLVMLVQDLRIRQPDFNGMKYLVATFQVPWGKHLNYDIIVIKKKKKDS